MRCIVCRRIGAKPETIAAEFDKDGRPESFVKALVCPTCLKDRFAMAEAVRQVRRK